MFSQPQGMPGCKCSLLWGCKCVVQLICKGLKWQHFLLALLSTLFQSFIIFSIWKLFPEAKPRVTSFSSSQHTHRFRRRNPKSQSKLNTGRKFGSTVGKVKEDPAALFMLQNEDRRGNSLWERCKSCDTNDQDLRSWQFYTFSNK